MSKMTSACSIRSHAQWHLELTRGTLHDCSSDFLIRIGCIVRYAATGSTVAMPQPFLNLRFYVVNMNRETGVIPAAEVMEIDRFFLSPLHQTQAEANKGREGFEKRKTRSDEAPSPTSRLCMYRLLLLVSPTPYQFLFCFRDQNSGALLWCRIYLFGERGKIHKRGTGAGEWGHRVKTRENITDGRLPFSPRTTVYDNRTHSVHAATTTHCSGTTTYTFS